MTDHTPTPWHIYDDADPHHIKIMGVRSDIGGAHVADVLFQANADYIVKAVNSYQAMFEALEAIAMRDQEFGYDAGKIARETLTRLVGGALS